jgi:hypothetical protein
MIHCQKVACFCRIGCVFNLNLKESLDGFRKALEFLKRSFGILIMTDSYRHFVC